MTSVVLMIAIAVLDQLAKLAVVHHIALGESIPIIEGLFALCRVHNYGAAFGAFHGMRYPLIAISLAAIAAFVAFRRQMLASGTIGQVVTGLALGGIVGNMIDRIKTGYVVDFLDFFHGQWHFPAFNVADSAITIAVALYLAHSFIASGKERKGGRLEDGAADKKGAGGK